MINGEVMIDSNVQGSNYLLDAKGNWQSGYKSRFFLMAVAILLNVVNRSDWSPVLR